MVPEGAKLLGTHAPWGKFVANRGAKILALRLMLLYAAPTSVVNDTTTDRAASWYGGHCMIQSFVFVENRIM